MRIGDAGHGVGHARPGGHQGHAQAAGQLGVGVRHVDRGALVAHVDDADALGVQPHPDRHDVPAAQGEHALDATRLEEAGDDGGGRLSPMGAGVMGCVSWGGVLSPTGQPGDGWVDVE
jgi:hypothetical protein